KVTLGSREILLQFVSSNQLIAVVPDDLPVNRSLPLVVQVGDYFSAPETVLIAATWPVTLTSVVGSAGVVTMESSGLALARKGDVILTRHGPVRIDRV